MEQLKDNIVGIVDHYLRFHDLMTGEEAADKILSLISETEPVAEVLCSVGLEGCEISEQMLTAAMEKAVELRVIPKWSVDEIYLKNWADMKAILKAAVAA